MREMLDAILHALDFLDPYAIPFVWAFRVVAACAATFVLLNWLKYRGAPAEIPPHNRRANETAWALAAVGSIIGGVGFNALDVYWISSYSAEAPNVIVASVWGFWAAGLTHRAAARAAQPWLLWLAAGIILAGGLLIISLGGRVPG